MLAYMELKKRNLNFRRSNKSADHELFPDILILKDIEDANVSTAHPIDNIFFKPFIFTSLINLFNHGYVLIIYQKFTKINIIIKIN